MRRAILVLGCVAIGLLVWCIYFDLHCLDIGFYRR
nr:MAG TPA: MAS20 protein import receptor [Caudoviricetes sp.]